MGCVRLPNCAVVASFEPVTPKKSRWNCSGLLDWLRLSAMEQRRSGSTPRRAGRPSSAVGPDPDRCYRPPP